MMTNLNKEESGRSMVEMLGVLAVIGVLSITGISGYTTAMNKHKANEILDAASKRAVAVSTQIQRGSTSPTLGEFDDNEVGGATFDEEVIVSGDKFTIGYTLTDDNVRNQIKSIAGTDGIIRGITNSGFIYNNDLTTDARASDFDGSESNCDTTKYTWCGDIGKCIAGVDQDENCPSDCATAYTGSTTDSGVGTKQIGNTSCYCPANTKWNGSECKSTGPVFKIVKCNGSYCTHMDALTACGSGWELASLAKFFEGMGVPLGGNSICKYYEWDSDEDGTNYYYDCSSYYENLKFEDDSPIKSISAAGCVWLANCWEEGDGGEGKTPCASSTSGSAWGVDGTGGVYGYTRDSNAYALCVR